MNRKTALVTGGMAATVVVATVAAVPALAASGTKTVTEHFDAKSTSSTALSRTNYVLTDKDVKGKKEIGRDVLYCTGIGAGTSHCHVAFGQKGGLLYAKFALSETGVLKGTVTGGTGSFAHAKGTLTGQAVSRKDVKITLHYKK